MAFCAAALLSNFRTMNNRPLSLERAVISTQHFPTLSLKYFLINKQIQETLDVSSYEGNKHGTISEITPIEVMIESKLSPDVGRCEVHVCGKTSNKDAVFKLEEVIAR